MEQIKPKHYILEDSSFIIALIDNDDELHDIAWRIFSNFLKTKEHIRVLIPSIAFFESLAVLTRKGVKHKDIDNKLWKLLHIYEIFNISLIETTAFKFCKKYCHILRDDSFKDNLNRPAYIKTMDFLISCTGLDYEAQILTLDRGMWSRIKKFYPFIYYCKYRSEIERFFNDLQKTIQKLE